VARLKNKAAKKLNVPRKTFQVIKTGKKWAKPVRDPLKGENRWGKPKALIKRGGLEREPWGHEWVLVPALMGGKRETTTGICPSKGAAEGVSKKKKSMGLLDRYSSPRCNPPNKKRSGRHLLNDTGDNKEDLGGHQTKSGENGGVINNGAWEAPTPKKKREPDRRVSFPRNTGSPLRVQGGPARGTRHIEGPGGGIKTPWGRKGKVQAKRRGNNTKIS